MFHSLSQGFGNVTGVLNHIFRTGWKLCGKMTYFIISRTFRNNECEKDQTTARIKILLSCFHCDEYCVQMFCKILMEI